MSSTGQAVGMVVGGAIGFFAGGNVMLGASIGGAIGGYIDPPKGADIVGPRLSDRRVQVASYGYQLPRLYGTMEVAGCVFWVENDELNEHENKKKQGGKGGSRATNTTYTYSVTFGVALAQCATRAKAGVRRIKIAGQLVYDAGSGDLDSIIASNIQQGGAWKFYDGRDDQAPDPRMQADKGINNVSGHPGLCWLAIYDLDLTEKYSNSLAAAQVQVEIVCESSGIAVTPLVQVNADSSGSERRLESVIFMTDKVEYSVFIRDAFHGNVTGIEFWRGYFGENNELFQSTATGIGIGAICRTIPLCQTDELCGLLQIAPASPYDTESVVAIYNLSGGIAGSEQIPDTDFPIYKEKTAAVDENDWFIASREGMEIYKFTNRTISGKTAAAYNILSIGLSESFVFGIKFEPSTTTTLTIYKFDRTTLALIETWTTTENGILSTIKVVDDTTIYTAIDGGGILKWVSGAVVDDLGELLPVTFNDQANTLPGWYSVFSESPPYVVSTSNYSALNNYIHVGHANNLRVPIKLHDLIIEECSLSGVSAPDLDLSALTNSDVRGYAVTGGGAVRGGLEPLQAAFPFDVIQSGYKIKFISRGAAPVANIPETDLGARPHGDDFPTMLIDVREMGEQLPESTTIIYLDADREYDNGEQTMHQPGSTGVSERRLELALVMTADEAVQAADVLNKKQRAERNVLTFNLPPPWRHLEPADVVTINHRARAIDCRLINIQYLPDGRLECSALPTSAASYSSTATGSESAFIGQLTVPLRGTTKAVLLDIPRIVSTQDAPGISAALYGEASGWPGGILMRSDDGGQTWPSMTGFADKSEVFTAVDALGAGRTDIVDASSTVTVAPNWNGADLYSITELQMFAGGNLAAFGADGRWEIIAFRTVVDNTGSYTLRDFMRGRYGTEWAAALHEAGDQLVMLNTTDSDFIGLSISALNSSRLWRAVTNNADINSAPDLSYTYSGVNLKPLSPVYINGARDPSSGDWTLSAIPRSRVSVEPFSGLSTPTGETYERYDVEIYDATFSTIKRTFTGLSSPDLSYTSVNQFSDFGANQLTLHLKWYMLSPTVGRGYPLQTSITRASAGDPLGEYVTLLMHMTDPSLADVKGHAVTVGGDAARVSAPTLIDGYGLGLDGAGDYVYVPYVLNDFNWWSAPTCIEAFIDMASFTGASYVDGLSRSTLIGNASPTTSTNYWSFGPRTDGKISFAYWNGSTLNQLVSGSAISTGTRTHIAFCSDSTGIRIYVDGAQVASGTISGTPQSSTSVNLVFGQINNNSINGKMNQVRITRGGTAARYTADFTVPTVAFPDP